MHQIGCERRVARSMADTAPVFDGPVRGWLPVMVGPDEATWRTLTTEGWVTLRLVVAAGPAWVLPDGTHHRRLRVEPDRTSFRDLVTAAVTPRVEGELVLAPDDPGVRLSFQGATLRRSWVTGPLERRILGDPLSRSGLNTLLDRIAERLGGGPSSAEGDTAGVVRCIVVRPGSPPR